MTRRSAIPVLAYLSSTTFAGGAAKEAANQLEGEMIAKYLEERDLFTIFLHFGALEADTQGHGGLVLQYDADKIVASLEPELIQLSTSQLSKLQRQGNATLSTLRLCTKEPCPVLCPNAHRSTIRSSPSLQRIALFARAQIVNVIFDLNSFGLKRRQCLDRLVSPPHSLRGIGIDTTERNYTLVDLGQISAVEEDTSDAPPSYEAKQAPKATDVSPFTTDDVSQTAIHKGLSAHCESRPLTPVPEPSPTEVATSPSSGNLKSQSSSVVDLYSSHPDAPKLQLAVTNVLRTILPEVLPGMLAMSINLEGIAGAAANKVLDRLRVDSPELRTVVVTVVRNALPQVLLDVPSLDNILKPLAEAALDKHFDDALWRAEDGLEETSNNNRTDLELISKDKLHDFNVTVDEKIEEAEAKISEVVDGLKDQADLVFHEIHERLAGLNGINGLKNGIGDLLRKEEEKMDEMREKIQRERRKLKRTKEGLKWKLELMGMERKKLEKERKRARRERKRMKKERLRSADSGFQSRRR
ncbi:hypothetical protein E8E13_009325 [Curvularia kusanoi]|uniref:Uncharacterized protein n=1 Tax=Curvularia kusanoi TaxID=90978 RepID=A0A9P4WCH1_CURKU|nr:hypothetical protein E8E13_009325 [Curvularia kusanoi]